MDIILSDNNCINGRHSRENGNPEKHWIPGQARNDKLHNRYMAIYKNQSGAALVIALIMMIVLTLIGLASIFSSTFEIKISGNKRCSTDAFYAADSGVQVVEGRIDNFNINLYNTGTYNPFTDANNINVTNAQVTITHDTTQEGAPRGFGFSATNFEFEHFLIASIGQTCPNPIPSTTTVQEKLVRLVPTQQGGY